MLFDEDQSSPGDDAALDAVFEALRGLDLTRERMAGVLRVTFDQLYDGQRTGRYRWDQLFKTEKTHFGTLVEINLQREFEFKDGDKLDYEIAGVDVDCKYSQKMNGWMIPPIAIDHICLVVTADDSQSRWSAGLVRVRPEYLRQSKNWDGKKNLNPVGFEAIRWLTRDEQMPQNLLLHMLESDVERIFSHRGSGQKRINELFRLSLGTPVWRGVVATVAQQHDYMKRVRASGGARQSLRPEGILILGDYKDDGLIAQALDVPVPSKGHVMSVRVCPAEESWAGPAAVIDGKRWRVAGPSDPAVDAPLVTRKKKSSADLTSDGPVSIIEHTFESEEA